MSLVALPRPVEAVVFDMDGLLVDSERVFRDAMFAVSERWGRPLTLEVFLSMVGSPKEQNIAVARAHFGPDVDYDRWWDEVGALAHAQFEVDLQLKAGVLDLLDLIDRHPRLPRAIATSSSHDAVQRQLGPLGLLGRFDAVVARADYARGKPSPDPFLLAAERLGVAPQACLALEDSHNGVRAAHAAGMMTIMVPDLLAATEEMQSLCVAIADTLHAVGDMLGAQRGLAAV